MNILHATRLASFDYGQILDSVRPHGANKRHGFGPTAWPLNLWQRKSSGQIKRSLSVARANLRPSAAIASLVQDTIQARGARTGMELSLYRDLQAAGLSLNDALVEGLTHGVVIITGQRAAETGTIGNRFSQSSRVRASFGNTETPARA